MRRALILAAPLTLALTLVACGDDDDDGPADTATDATKPDSTDGGEITIPDISIPDISIPDISIPDISIPDISIPDISIPDISIPDLSLPEDAADLFGQVFPNLDEGQIDCLVENLSGEFDPSAVTNLLDECNIDTQDLLPGG